MVQLTPNHLVLRKAINGPRAVYGIAKYPKLFLATDGKGGGSWRIRYRPRPGQQQCWHTITNDARNVEFEAIARKATELLSNLALHGIDPKSQRPRQETTFGDSFGLWLERHGKVHKKSWKEDEALYRRHIGSRLGNDVLTKIERTRVIEVLDDIAKSATPIQANRCQSVISAVFSWALDEGKTASHPALRIRKRGAEVPRDQVMDDQQLRQFWQQLGTLELHVEHMIKLLLLLGCRLNEIVGAEIKEFSLADEPHWVLPTARSKNNLAHVFPLPPLAVQIVRDAHEACSDSTYLFPARFVGDRPFDKKFISRLCKRVYRRAGVPDIRLHDLRHQAATGMAKCGVPLEIRQLVQNQITGRSKSIGSLYDQHDYFQEKLKALTLWERRLLAIIEERDPSADRY